MGDHKFNPQALSKQMTPPMPPRVLQVGLEGVWAPKKNLLILPPERIRTREDGATEVFLRKDDADPEEWHVPPPPLEVIVQGAALPMSKLDYVIQLQGVCINTTLMDTQGRHPMKKAALAEIARFDAQRYLAMFGESPANTQVEEDPLAAMKKELEA